MSEQTDPLENWVEELDEWVRTCRKDGTSKENPLLFQQVIPRIKKLCTILLEEPEEERPVRRRKPRKQKEPEEEEESDLSEEDMEGDISL